MLLPLDHVRTAVAEPRVEAIEVSATRPPTLPGPVAQTTFDTASATTKCGWGIPQTDGGFFLAVAVIDGDASSALVTALTESDIYTPSERDGVVQFSITITEGIGTALGYAFDGKYWAIANGTILSEGTAAELAADAVDALRAANN